jgi:hypothetical protein
MQTLAFALKFVAGLLGALVLLVALFVAYTLLRKSLPIVFRGDLEQLVASGPYNSSGMASEICGTPVDMLVDSPSAEPGKTWPKVTLLTWRPFFPLEGTLSAHISGIGVNRDRVPVTGQRCVATITFSYRFAWVDNGRAYTLDSQFVGTPQVTRSR